MKKSTRLKTPAIPVGELPADREMANIVVAEIGDLQRKRIRLETEMNDALAEIKARFEADASPLGSKIAVKLRCLQLWCESNRDELTRDRRTKTVRFAAGEVAWRDRPPRVIVRSVAKAIAWFHANGFTQFVRIRQELDKPAMLAEPRRAVSAPGVRIASAGEEFIVRPLETQLEEVAA